MKKILLTSILLGTMILSSVGASAMPLTTGLENFTGWHMEKQNQSWNYYSKGEKIKNFTSDTIGITDSLGREKFILSVMPNKTHEETARINF